LVGDLNSNAMWYKLTQGKGRHLAAVDLERSGTNSTGEGPVNRDVGCSKKNADHTRKGKATPRRGGKNDLVVALGYRGKRSKIYR